MASAQASRPEARDAAVRSRTVGLLLAGGLSRRMGGGDKCLAPVAGRPMLAHVMARLEPQVARLVLNANGDPARFGDFGLPIVPDPVAGFAGPLAGVLAGLLWARAQAPEAVWIASAATDTPFFPKDLVVKLHAAIDGDPGSIALAATNGRVHPVFGLWPVALADDLARALRDDVRKVMVWVERHPHVVCDFGRFDANRDPFFNANTPEELATVEALIREDAL
jgi:molybdopterin-guanine dinucleotide biosynthesis protein A